MKSMGSLLSVLLFTGALNFSELEGQARNIKSYCVIPSMTNIGPCSNLSFYMKNVSQYFTSNTQMHFKTGKYYLKSPLSVANVKNFSITGEYNVIIRCCDTYIHIANSVFVEIRNIRFINCGSKLSIRNNVHAALILHNIISVTILNAVLQNCLGYAVTGINVQGNSCFENVTIFQDYNASMKAHMNGIAQLLFQDIISTDSQQTQLLISGCRFYNMTLQKACTADCDLAAIKFSFSQQNYPAKIQITNTTIAHVTSNGGPLVGVSYSSKSSSKVIFLNSKFINNNNKNHSTIEINTFSRKQINTTQNDSKPQWLFLLLSCKLHNNTSELKSILNIFGPTVEYNAGVLFTININSTSITYNEAKEASKVEISNYNLSSSPNFVISKCNFISNKGFGLEFKTIVNVAFDGPNTFHRNLATDFLVSFNKTVPWFMGKNVFSKNHASVIIYVDKYVSLLPNAELSFISNSAPSNNHTNYILYVSTDAHLHPCIFQFMKFSTLDESTDFHETDKRVIFSNNIQYSAIIFGTSLNSCYWARNCIFANSTKTPGDIYEDAIHYIHDNDLIDRSEANVCYCHDNKTDCIRDHFYPIQASRTVSLSLKLTNSKFATAMYINSSKVLTNPLAPACDLQLVQNIYAVSNKCTILSYDIISNVTGTYMCALYLTTTNLQRPVNVYYVTLQKCPPGFTLINGKCDCDPILTRNIPYMKCNPENGSILHGPGSWIGVTKDQMDYMYKPDCVSYYCSYNTFFMQLSNPDVQCLNNRTGLICGHCPTDMDAMFGSLRCGKCSNYWLFFIPVFLIIGIALVLALFILNLTVVEGKINGFIFYVNVLNIFMYKVFPLESVAYVIVSLANLDWGIEMCFYRGMTDYAKVWLRFAFPVYLFLIVLALIYASRYSNRIEKLTRKRVIPVIATLFLLSYNKLLLVTNTALFYYVKVYKLHSNETLRVWGLDTSVPLFGLKFSILFVICLLIFLVILVPANILLLFTKFCYRSKLVVEYLKPFLDAYHAPIKDNHHYFLGMELFVRAVVFIAGNNLLAVHKTLALCVFLDLVFTSYCCAVRPFKKLIDNVIYITFVYALVLVAVLNIAFQFKKTSSYILLFNLSFSISLMLFLGILYYHVHKYTLQSYKIYRKCFIIASDFVTQYIKLVIQKYNSPNRHAHEGIPIDLEECQFQEELLIYED